MPNAAPRLWTRADLPVEVRFGMRPPYALFAWSALLGILVVYQTNLSDPEVFVPILLLVGILAPMLGGWLVSALRGTASGTLRIDGDRLTIIQRSRTQTFDLATCRSFRLSPTRNQILFVAGAGDPSQVDHLRLSRQELQCLVDLLNELCGTVEAELDVTAASGTSAKLPPPRKLRGPRLGPTGWGRYVLRTVYITWGTFVLAALLLFPMAIVSLRCSQPVSDACALIGPIVAAFLLSLIPVLPLSVYLIRRYCATAHRLRDLDDLPTRAAVWRAMIPFTAARNRAVSEYGTPGPNRFGPPPE